ncbi:Golgi-resident adenosine 3',5'-bisphosphate 3'-phosphatase isoform X2 [Podarcis raffonei]|uniref:Golgi-resident adenosine 3',5'-bisphosphate 3'-phosphatase isoform X2 n=1 Tax=Podarcis raffonei TaxID=65483 RepID=UPI0023293A4B|nr:Golgi-resident adenosine 3',5'-bisphosphate 3'-phosphatase isoform X2 [Podarcis raffonei]
MAPMGIRLSPLGMAVVGLLGLGVLYHLYSGILAGRFAFFMLGGGGGEGESAAAAGGSEAAGGPPASGTVDLRELLAASVAAAARGGAEVRRVRDSNVLNEKAKGKTREGADEKMTSGDVLSNRKMYYLLKAAFPGVQINTEEHVDADDQEIISWDRTIPEAIKNQIQPKLVQADSVTVWIDPLDATQEYTENLRQYVTTMVCAAVNGKPVIGVIHKPFSGYTGYKVLSLLDVPEKDQEKADVYIHVTYIKKWDICAGNAVLKALGGQMTTLAGEEISYTGSDGNEGGLIASINIDHRALVEKLPVLDKASQN